MNYSYCPIKKYERLNQSPFRKGVNFLLKTFDKIRLDNSLYYFTLPTFVLIACRLYMSHNLYEPIFLPL